MSNITYTTVNETELDRLAPLWLKLRDHHAGSATHFGRSYAGVTWDRRKEGLLRKAAGRLHLDAARDGDTIVGYCITSVNDERIGEIESIFVEPACRRSGIGAGLMERALAWLNTMGVERTILGVGEGNDSAIGFYRRFGFEVRTTIMEQVRRDD